MKNKFLAIVCLGLATLVGCGGGGGGSSNQSSTPTPLAVGATSYDNKNNISLDLPQLSSVGGNSIAESVTFGDFFQDGTYSAFVAVAQSGAFAKAYFFKKNANGAWDDSTASLLTSTDVCATVTQAITADLNGDGKPDVYVACGGGSASKQVVFMSQRSASTYVRLETNFTLQSWGAAAGDIDGDGDVDVVATDSGGTVALMNDGQGNLVKDSTSRVPTAGAGLPTLHRKVFLLPRRDALPDLVIAGSGVGLNATTIFLKNDATMPGHFYVNQATGASSLFESKVLNGITTAKVYDVIESDNFLYALAKYVPVENAATATEVLLLRYELTKNNAANSSLNLCSNSNNTCLPSTGSNNALTLPSDPYSPSDHRFVSQLKLLSSTGRFVAYDGACTFLQGDPSYASSSCGFSVLGP
jgi:hypothetical protein